MRGSYGISSAVILASIATLHCGAEPGQGSPGQGSLGEGQGYGLLVSVQTEQQLEGSFEHDDRVIRFSSNRSAPLAGDVRVDLGALRYELHYDYETGQVVADGYGGALDYEAQRPLLEAIEAVSARLQSQPQEAPLHEHMLYAGLSMLRDSGGMPLEPKVFDLGRAPEVGGAELDGAVLDKSIEDDGISCIKSGRTYYVSFDYGDTTVIDGELQAGVFECNGQCGPYCTQLQPWRMWTLDCLEHDACCNTTSDDACWTPLGECGDEYDAAMGDFLRGYAPFSRHCGG
jgi:hypothetical protein